MANMLERFRKGWNAFIGRDPTYRYYGRGSTRRPDRMFYFAGRNMIANVENRIAMDVAAIKFEHVKLDEDGNYKESIKGSSLARCLQREANIDQTGRSFIQDIVMSMFDEGVIGVLPTDCDVNPEFTEAFNVRTMRVGKVVQWYPNAVTLNVYNERTGQRQDVTYPKSMVAIIENPLYAIMNEPNGTMQQLQALYQQLDTERAKGNRLDLIIQLPYALKSPAKLAEAKKRRQEISDQLQESEYGIAYIDGTEHVTQLNRAIDNTIWNQINELRTQLYNQLGLTPAIFDGTADEQAMINYYNRTIEPICAAIADEFIRKFISKTAQSQGQSIFYHRDIFKLAGVSELSDMADKLTRNAIMSSNEVRVRIGLKPSDQPDADELRNKNLNQDQNPINGQTPNEEDNTDEVKQFIARYGRGA